MRAISEKEKHNRQSIRLKEYDYSTPGAYFVTICMKEMKCILGKIQNGRMRLSRIGRIIHRYWEEIPNHFDSVKLDVFVVMPNHYFQWQRNYYEHIVRNEDGLNRIREYILYNPLQWQSDRENPEYIQDKNYDVQWADFEKLIYGKQKQNRQGACST